MPTTPQLIETKRNKLTSSKSDYSFVNWIRFVAMLSIVYEHSLEFHVLNDINQSDNTGNAISQAYAIPWIIQPMKFGTICFFTISGYLLGKHLSITESPWRYYKRRLRVVGVPYLIAVGLFYLMSIHTYGVIRGRYSIDIWTIDYLMTQLSSLLLLSSFWFVFSFLIALGLFLLFWHKSNQPLAGYIAGAIALFYGINVYYGWIEQRHTLAMPAYLFYLWLGVWLSRHNNVLEYLQSLPNWLLTSLVFLFLFLAVIESNYLMQLKSISPFNTLRLSNQLFSITVFIWLLRNDFISRLTWFNPRIESFGIYLYHLYFVTFVNALSISFNILIDSKNYTGLELAGVTIVRWIIIYALTLIFVKLVNQTRFKWLLGS